MKSICRLFSVIRSGYIRQRVAELFYQIKICCGIILPLAKNMLVIRVLLSFVLSILQFMSLLFTKDILDGIVKVDSMYLDVTTKVFFLGIIRISIMFLQRKKESCIAIQNEKIEHGVNQWIINVATNAPFSVFDSQKYKNALENVRENTRSIVNVVWRITELFEYICSLVINLAAILSDNYVMFLILTITNIPASIYEHYFLESMFKWNQSGIIIQRKLNYIEELTTTKNHAMMVRAFGMADFLKKRHVQIWIDYFSNKERLIRKREHIQSMLSLAPEIVTICLLLSVFNKTLNGVYTAGDFSFFLGAIYQYSVSFNLTISHLLNLNDDITRISSMKEITTMGITETDDGILEVPDEFDIEFENVCFKYPNSAAKALDNVSFKIESGKHIGLVGFNGAGKSTILKLLLRLYNVDDGEILINDKNINEYSVKSLRNSMGVYLQNMPNFAFTIRDNFSVSSTYDPSMLSDDQIYKALKEVGVLDVLQKSKEGLDSCVTKEFSADGIELSGGQNQRLALARVLIRNRKLLLLDEPMAALDPNTAQRLMTTFNKNRKATIIMVSHKLDDMKYFDKIFLFSEGRIVESGSHIELINRRGTYYQLYSSCKKNYEK